MSNSRLKPRIVATLVHGTFSPNAQWMQPDSVLCESVLSARGRGQVLLSPFHWSGDNSHQARLRSGADLAEHLKRLRSDYPRARHVVIAHSHGGNVALYALRDGTVREAVDQIICMATPFIHCAWRDTDHILLALSLTLGTCLGIAALWMWLIPGMDVVDGLSSLVPDIIQAPVHLAAVLLYLLVTVLLLPGCQLLVFSAVSWCFEERIKRASTAHLSRLGLPDCGKVRVCVLRYAQDEAALYLGLLQRLANVPHASMTGVIRLTNILVDFGQALADESVIGALLMYVAMILLGPLLLACWIIAAMAHWLFRAHGAAFGELLAEGLLVDLTIRPHPPLHIPAEATHYSALPSAKDQQRPGSWLPLPRLRLVHTEIYADPRVLAEIRRLLG